MNGIAVPQGGDQELFDIGQEAIAGDGAITNQRRHDAVQPQGGDE
jgi:hypothetical protein